MTPASRSAQSLGRKVLPSWVMPWMNSSLLEGETIRMHAKIRLAQQGTTQATCQGARRPATSCLRKSFKKVRAHRQNRCQQAKPAFYLLYKRDRKSTRLNSSHLVISYAVFCLKKKKKKIQRPTVTLHTIDSTRACYS